MEHNLPTFIIWRACKQESRTKIYFQKNKSSNLNCESACRKMKGRKRDLDLLAQGEILICLKRKDLNPERTFSACQTSSLPQEETQ